MNKEQLIDFHLRDLAKWKKAPFNIETLSLEAYTRQILNNLGLSDKEIEKKLDIF